MRIANHGQHGNCSLVSAGWCGTVRRFEEWARACVGTVATPRGRPWAMVGASRSQLAALHWHPFDMVVQGQLQLKTRFETRSNLTLSQRRGQR